MCTEAKGGIDTAFDCTYRIGADVWCQVLESGFDECRIVPYRYPAGIALIAEVAESRPVTGGQW